MKVFNKALIMVAAATILPLTANANGNNAPSGKHYNLNIIGVENPKNFNEKNENFNGHVIFVKLGKGGKVSSKIKLVEGDFRVIDPDGTDNDGATFQLPANNCEAAVAETIVVEGDNTPNPNYVESSNCENPESLFYQVWARALGVPGGSAGITTCRTDSIDTDGNEVYDEICSTETLELEVTTGKGSKNFEDVTKELTTLCLDTDGNGVCDTREQLFAWDSETYWWDYANDGLRLLQLRFYELNN